ncbi:MAG: hypothetical protein M1836_007966 [Candelina mexicana]|nr:MAG: hypothetical protein M1836_007966 [Candelina mexicana]
MSSSDYHVKKIAIVGASGRVGGEILKGLLQANAFTITVLSRDDSTATFDANVILKKGSYDSLSFLESALQGQDVLVITLAGTVPPDVQSNLIKAAAAAKVPWILPNEYGQDGDNPNVNKAVPMIKVMKEGYRREIEELGVSQWIGVACSLWFDFSLKLGMFGIDIAKRTAEIYDDGTNAFTTCTVAQTGRAVARLLALPTTSSEGPSLSDYANKFIYINSFYVSQNEMLASVQRATKTTPSDWTVTYKPLDQWIQEGHEKFAKGDRWGMVGVLYGNTFKKGVADRFHGRELANKKLGLEEENVDEIVKKVVEEIEGTK